MSGFEDSFAVRIIEFNRFARERGLTAAVKESVDALEAVRTAGISDRDNLRIVLRAVLCSSKEEWDRFDEIFDSFWVPDEPGKGSRKGTSRKKPRRDDQPSTSQLFGQTSHSAIEETEGKSVMGASVQERLKRVDFSEVPQRDLAQLEEISRRLLRQMSLRLSRRLTKMAVSGRVDMRRTIRRNISRGADLIDLSFRGKRQQRNRLVIVLDISGSMNAYSIFLLKFAYTMQKHFRQVSTFLFSTRLEDITGVLRSRQLAEALNSLSQEAQGWAGGTKIGESLREFNFVHARRVLSRDAQFIILSDGWDTGEPEVLAAELAAIKRGARKLIWLNPLLGLSDYQPITRGMAAALPWIDVFAPAHNLESLLELERHLARS